MRGHWTSRTLVVFGCHQDDAVLRFNLAAFRRNNPHVAMLPCTYDAPAAGADIELFDQWPSKNRWKDCDYFLYEARARHPGYEWYVFLEWDCYFNVPLEWVYGEPGTDLILTDVRDARSKKWSWLKDRPHLPECLREHFLGTVPLCGVLARGSVLDRVAAFTPWPETVSEVRLPTIASYLGASMGRIDSRYSGIRCRPRHYLPLSRGAYHPLKTIEPSYWNKLTSLFRHYD